jgi:hypothetical protein
MTLLTLDSEDYGNVFIRTLWLSTVDGRGRGEFFPLGPLTSAFFCITFDQAIFTKISEMFNIEKLLVSYIFTNLNSCH